MNTAVGTLTCDVCLKSKAASNGHPVLAGNRNQRSAEAMQTEEGKSSLVFHNVELMPDGHWQQRQ